MRMDFSGIARDIRITTMVAGFASPTWLVVSCWFLAVGGCWVVVLELTTSLLSIQQETTQALAEVAIVALQAAKTAETAT